MTTKRLPKGRPHSTARDVGAQARSAPTPAALLREVSARLEAAANPAYARQILTYFKTHERIEAYGVRTPAFRALLGDAHAEVKDAWGFAEAVAFADLCLAERVFEVRGSGLALLGRFASVFEPSLLAQVRRWLEANRLDNWAAVDSCAAAVVSPLLARHPALVPRIARWSGSPNLWVRRMSVVPLVPFARDGEHLDQAYATVWALRSDREDLLHKACGWLLREAGKADAARLERFLLERGRALPRTTVRYAIERFPPATRRQLLIATK